MLELLQEYQDVLIACAQTEVQAVGHTVYSESYRLLLEEFGPTPGKLARVIAEYPDRGAESEIEYLRMLFADMRNPISSLTAISKLFYTRQSSATLRNTALERLIQHFASLEQRLNSLLNNLLLMREQYASATE